MDEDLKEPSGRPIGMTSSSSAQPELLNWLEIIKQLDNGCDNDLVHTIDENGRTALHYAALGIDHEKVIKLLKYGASVNVMDKDGMSPFLNAVIMGYKRVVTPMMERGAHIQAVQEKTGNTALHFAALNWNAILAETLVDKGANINQPNKEGLTPLHIAVNQLDLTMTELLLERGVKVNYLDHNGETALYKAVVLGEHRLVKMLIDKGSFINTQRLKSSETYQNEPGCSKNVMRRMELILDFKNSGKTPLHEAVSSENVKIVDLLLRHAWIDVKNNDGLTPLQCAIESGNATIVKRLISKGADLVEIRSWFFEKCQGKMNENVRKTVMIHLTKLGVAGLFSGNVPYDNFNEFSVFKNQCQCELERSKTKPFFDGVLFEVFHLPLRSIPANKIDLVKKALNSPELEDEFPLYIDVMKCLVLQSSQRCLLLAKGFVFFFILFKINRSNRIPPKNVMPLIFKRLSNVDLQNVMVFCENVIAKGI